MWFFSSLQIVKSAGHHVYADKPQSFNNAVKKVCNAVDAKLERDKEAEYEAMDNTVGPAIEQSESPKL